MTDTARAMIATPGWPITSGQPAEERQEREAQRAQPGPEPGEEQPLEPRIGAGERAASRSARSRTCSARTRRRCASAAIRATPPPGCGSSAPRVVRAHEHGPEPAAHSRPVARARAAIGSRRVVTDDAHAARRRRPRGSPARASRRSPPRAAGRSPRPTPSSSSRRPARHERGRVRSGQLHRHHDLVAVARDLERLHEAHAVGAAGRPRTSRSGLARPRRAPAVKRRRCRSTGGPPPRRTSRTPGESPAPRSGPTCRSPRRRERRRDDRPATRRARAVEREHEIQALGRRPGPTLAGAGVVGARRDAAAAHERAQQEQPAESPPLSVEPAHLPHRGAQGVPGQRRVRDEAIAPVPDLVAGRTGPWSPGRARSRRSRCSWRR